VSPVSKPDQEANSGKSAGSESPERQMAPKLPGNIPANAPVDLILGFIPENMGPVFNSKLACYLINDSPFFAYYSLGSLERGNFHHISSGLVESDTKNLITIFDQTAISKITAFHLQLIWLSDGKYSRKAPLDVLVDIHLVSFNKESYYRENDFFDEKAVLFSVSGKEDLPELMGIIEVPDTAKAAKADDISRQDPIVKKKESTSDTMEIDLHMDELDLQKSQFSLSGILALQMSRFHAALEEAVSKKIRRLVIIHGVGQGTLKMQIRKELQEKYPSYLFQDASFREYGFGATMVHLIADKKQ